MPMRVDAYTHFFPQKFFDKLNEVAGDYKDMGKRVRSLPALFDLDVRKKIVDGHKDYQQILSYPQPPVERFAKTPQDIDEFCKIINDGFAELTAKEQDHFPGWVAQVSLAASDAGVGGIPAVLEKDERARRADLDSSGARRRDAGLSRREEIAL
jgi:aminocarboxymuconate-semialdehyde decarboxylase